MPPFQQLLCLLQQTLGLALLLAAPSSPRSLIPSTCSRGPSMSFTPSPWARGVAGGLAQPRELHGGRNRCRMPGPEMGACSLEQKEREREREVLFLPPLLTQCVTEAVDSLSRAALQTV